MHRPCKSDQYFCMRILKRMVKKWDFNSGVFIMGFDDRQLWLIIETASITASAHKQLFKDTRVKVTHSLLWCVTDKHNANRNTWLSGQKYYCPKDLMVQNRKIFLDVFPLEVPTVLVSVRQFIAATRSMSTSAVLWLF